MNKGILYERSTSLDTAAAQALSQCKLTLTATFTDGSTETKAFAIKPREGFEHEVSNYWETYYRALHSTEDEEAAEMPADEPAIFTIEELS